MDPANHFTYAVHSAFQRVMVQEWVQDDTNPEVAALQAQLSAARAAYDLELSQQWRLPKTRATQLAQMIDATFETACMTLKAEHSTLIEVEQEVARMLNHRSASSAEIPPAGC